jgi:uncharacterized membrane protein (DUF373 family)
MPDYVRLIDKLERVLTVVLAVIMTAIVLTSMADFVVWLVKDLVTPPVGFLGVDKLLDVFGAFLLVLIGMELLETLKTYMRDHELHAEVIVLVAVIALARKIIVLDLKGLTPATLLGIAAVMLALGIVYYLIRNRRQSPMSRT